MDTVYIAVSSRWCLVYYLIHVTKVALNETSKEWNQSSTSDNSNNGHNVITQNCSIINKLFILQFEQHQSANIFANNLSKLHV